MFSNFSIHNSKDILEWKILDKCISCTIQHNCTSLNLFGHPVLKCFPFYSETKCYFVFSFDTKLFIVIFLIQKIMYEKIWALEEWGIFCTAMLMSNWFSRDIRHLLQTAGLGSVYRTDKSFIRPTCKMKTPTAQHYQTWRLLLIKLKLIYLYDKVTLF